MVEKITTNKTNVAVFFAPSIELITSIFGSDRAGPESNKASAGPLPIPLPRSACTIGTSVKVAKYINAPTTDANKFENIELPPTNLVIQKLGIIPSFPGRPRAKPAIKTPTNSNGMICFAKSQVLVSQALNCSLLFDSITTNPAIPTVNVITGSLKKT